MKSAQQMLDEAYDAEDGSVSANLSGGRWLIVTDYGENTYLQFASGAPDKRLSFDELRAVIEAEEAAI